MGCSFSQLQKRAQDVAEGGLIEIPSDDVPQTTTSTSADKSLDPEVAILPVYRPPSQLNYSVPQSDTESEVEGPSFSGGGVQPQQIPNLSHVSKEELYTAIQRCRAKVQRYRTKYSEAVRAFRELDAEKTKVEKILTESQDKALRRMSELREQNALEKQAKMHLEESLRMSLEEKDEKIKVLETKVNLLVKGGSLDALSLTSDTSEAPLVDIDATNETSEVDQWREKCQQMEVLLAKCKEGLTSNTAKITELSRQKTELEEKLEVRLKELEKCKSDLEMLRDSSKSNDSKISKELENARQEIAAKEIMIGDIRERLEKAEKQVREMSQTLSREREVRVQTESQLQVKIAELTKTLDEERKSCQQEMSRGKTDALSLMQQELEMAQQKWTQKMQASEKEFHYRLSEKENELRKVAKKIWELKAITEETADEVEECPNSTDGDSLVGQIDGYKKKVDELEARVAALSSRNDALDAESRERAAKNGTFLERITELEEQLRSALERHKALQMEVNSLTASLKDSEANNETKVHALHAKVKVLTEENGRLKNDLEEREKSKGKLSSKIEKLSSDLQTLKESCNTLQSALNAGQKAAKESQAQHEAKVASLQERIKSLVAANEQLERGAQSRAQEEGDQSVQLHEARRDAMLAASRCRELETELERLMQTHEKAKADYNETVDDLNVTINALRCEVSAGEKRVSELETRVEEGEKMGESLREEVATAHARYAALENDLQADRKSYVKARENHDQKVKDLAKQIESLTSAKEEFDKLSADLESRLKAKQQELELTQGTLEQLQAELRASQEDAQKLQQTIRDTEEKYSTKFEKLKERLQSLSDANNRLQEEVKSGENVCAERANALSTLENEYSRVCEEREQLQRQCTMLQDQHEQLKASNEQRLSEFAAQLDAVKAEKEAVDSQLASSLESSKITIDQLQSQLDALRAEVENANRGRDDLSAQLELSLKQQRESQQELQEKEGLLQQRIAELTKELGDMETEYKQRTEKDALKIADLQREVKTTIEQYEQLRVEADAQKKLDEQNANAIQMQLSEALAEVEALRESNARMERELGEKEGTLEEHSKTLAALQQQYDDALVKCRDAESELEAAKKSADDAQLSHEVDMQELEERVLELTSANERLTHESEERAQQQSGQSDKLNELRRELKKALERGDKFQADLRKLQNGGDEDNSQHTSSASAISIPNHQTPVLSNSAEPSGGDHTNEMESLKSQLAKYQDEVRDLRAVLCLRPRGDANSANGDNTVHLGPVLPEPTEYEYLRNIIFEYMMGRETETLSKVIAAVLKFSQDQTKQIVVHHETTKAHHHHHSTYHNHQSSSAAKT